MKSFKKSPTAAKRRFRKQYPWAFRGTTRTPSAFALPKRKKEFLSGRLIISFVRAFTRALLEASARLLYQLTAIAFPESFASGDVYEMLRAQDCFSHLQDPNGLGLSQSGHLGFFHKCIAGSIFPQAWKLYLLWHQRRHGGNQDTTFTVDLKESQQPLRIFRGIRRRRAKQQVTLRLEYTPDIFHHALQMQNFGAHYTPRQSDNAGKPHGVTCKPCLTRDGDCEPKVRLG